MRHNHLIDFNGNAALAHMRKRYRKTSKERLEPIFRSHFQKPSTNQGMLPKVTLLVEYLGNTR